MHLCIETIGGIVELLENVNYINGQPLWMAIREASLEPIEFARAALNPILRELKLSEGLTKIIYNMRAWFHSLMISSRHIWRGLINKIGSFSTLLAPCSDINSIYFDVILLV